MLGRWRALIWAGVGVTALATRPARGEQAEPEVAGGEGAQGAFVQAAHARLHRRWAEGILGRLPASGAAGRRVVVAVTLTPAGGLVESQFESRSGSADFDRAALDALAASAPFPAAPPELLSDDGQVHLRWALSRDYRRCAEVALLRRESPLEQALPRLLAQGRDDEAIRRVRAAAGARVDPALTLLARAWLARAITQPPLVVSAAIGLAGAGDGSVALILEAALQRGDRPALVAAALTRIKRPVCPVVRPALMRPSAEVRAASVEAVRASGGDASACLPALLDIALDDAAPPAERAQAVEALAQGAATADDDPEPDTCGASARRNGGVDPPLVVSRAQIQDAIVDLVRRGPPLVRVAALAAQSRTSPAARRAALAGLVPLLHDGALEVRTAAAAAVVRVGGEAAFPQLRPLFRETDARPYQALAEELGRTPGPPSAALLARMLRKEDRRVRVAAAAALARRADEAARAVLAPLGDQPDSELRLFAASTLPGDDQAAAARAAGPEARAFQPLLGGAGRDAAGQWLLAVFDRLPPQSQVERLGEWLASTHAAPPP
jgi:TonB family protein